MGINIRTKLAVILASMLFAATSLAAVMDIADNGGFETGDFTGWIQFPGLGTQAITTPGANIGPPNSIYAFNSVVPVRGLGDPAVDNLLKLANLEAGNLTPGASITVNFDMKGSLSGAGGVVFPELFSESSGGATGEILSGGPLAPNAFWTTYSYTTTLGADVSGGVTLQLKTSCGPIEGCGVDATFDNITITTDVSGTVMDIAVNGGFETGDFTGWTQFPGLGTQTITTPGSNLGGPPESVYAFNSVVPVRGLGDPAVDNLLKNANLQAGNLTPGASITVYFEMRGSLSGDGGVVFAELFSESSGGATGEILGGGPLAPNAFWTPYSYTTTLGPDVSGGVTLQLKTSCGSIEGCGVDAFFDNVTITTDVTVADTDGDGVSDSTDNCTNVANPAQIDTDADGHGNICDGDFTNDCNTNIFDLFDFKANFAGTDQEFDLNSTGGPVQVNIFDLFAFKGLFGSAPGPSPTGSLCNP